MCHGSHRGTTHPGRHLVQMPPSTRQEDRSKALARLCQIRFRGSFVLPLCCRILTGKERGREEILLLMCRTCLLLRYRSSHLPRLPTSVEGSSQCTCEAESVHDGRKWAGRCSLTDMRERLSVEPCGVLWIACFRLCSIRWNESVR